MASEDVIYVLHTPNSHTPVALAFRVVGILRRHALMLLLHIALALILYTSFIVARLYSYNALALVEALLCLFVPDVDLP